MAAWMLALLLLAGGARTLRVGPGGYPSITAALADARDGDTVRVAAGRYAEPTLEIRRRVVLTGENRPVLDGQRKREIMVVKADGVTIQGFDFTDSGFSGYEDVAALRLYQCRNTVVRDNRFTGTFFGIYNEHSTGARIENNILQSTAAGETLSGNGIHAWKSDSLIVRNNRISGHRDGIYFEFVTGSLVTGNHSAGNMRYGLHFMFSNDDAYTGNHFEANGAGIAVMYSKRMRMTGNTFIRNRGDAAYGILLKDITDSAVEDNRFLSNTVGVVMEGSSRLMLARNTFHNNGWALRIQASCEAVEIRENDFQRNSFDVSTNGSLVLNSFDRNYWDRYEGFDLNQDGTGDVPHTPTSLFAVVVERNPIAMMLFRSAVVHLLDRSERILPGLTPAGLKDFNPAVKPHRPLPVQGSSHDSH